MVIDLMTVVAEAMVAAKTTTVTMALVMMTEIAIIVVVILVTVTTMVLVELIAMLVAATAADAKGAKDAKIVTAAAEKIAVVVAGITIVIAGTAPMLHLLAIVTRPLREIVE